ncbi:MHYT domain-containing protein [Noviherbaspirillum aerium]|uniref:MHYT domain-containing protein n=1 Tax=Noviherbaspirillum aerium TaxID=2588497 RepID=UPI00124D62D4|nr:MHYT domain-containing protein [Noviherbaspirillum aerium]
MLSGHYEIPLVLVSILVAIFASYTALSLAGRVKNSHGLSARLWISGGGLAMGTGIWAMHFIGMLAFRLPIPIGYDIPITLLSLLLPVTVSGMALWQVSLPNLRLSDLAISSVLMGVGINAMHYTGMAAMKMNPGIIYDPPLFILSVAIAIIASAGALWIAFKLQDNTPNAWRLRIGAAVVMGFAIVGMHYTGMAAASFPLGSVCTAASRGVSQDALAVLVIIATVGVLTVALMASIYDARLESGSRNLALSQAKAEERQRMLMLEREARSQAERMSEMKDEFLATLSHELRTPLNAILGWAQILQRGVTDEATLRKGLDTIERNAHAQAQLIEDLLDMSKIISGKVRLEMKSIDPVGFIEGAMETVRPAAMAKNIRMEKSLDRDTGPIYGDPNRLQQVMWNLLSNAVKFTPGGGTVRLEMEKHDRGIRIRVSDSGIGISPDFLPYVFDRFRQADASTTRRYGGLGLGLSIARQLVELQGGTIEVASAGENMGTTFTIHLPLIEAQPEPLMLMTTRDRTNAAPALLDAVDLSAIKVLVVDDEPDARDLVEHILSRNGASVITAANAFKALALVEDVRPDVIVSDIGMPDMDGYEFMRQVRMLSEARGGNVPALALTAFTRSDDRMRALRAGFNSYMSKPVEPPALLAAVASLNRKVAEPTSK